MNYTKGEWGVDLKINHWGDKCYAVKSADMIAIISEGDNAEANAQLIASAPDLYEALKRLYKMFSSKCGGCIKTEHALLEAQEALAKAEVK